SGEVARWGAGFLRRADDLHDSMRQMTTKLRRLETWLGEMDGRVRRALDDALDERLNNVLSDAVDALEQRITRRMETAVAALEKRLERRLHNIICRQH
ncbi:Protein of unknown function, partial [Gryllus bimaculatus]